MRLRLELRPAADRDMIEIAEYIAADNLDAAIRFLEAARRSMEFLTDTPRAGPTYTLSNRRLVGLRKWAVDGFGNYQIFYRVTDDSIQVVQQLLVRSGALDDKLGLPVFAPVADQPPRRTPAPRAKG